MIRGDDKVIACPACGRLARVFTLRSGNTMGSVYWTDGKWETPMLLQAPPITRCSGCEAFFWTHEAPSVGEASMFASEYIREWLLERGASKDEADEITKRVPGWHKTPKAWRKAPPVRRLREEEFYEAIESGFAENDEQERDLRILAWRASNDAFVGCDPDFPGVPPMPPLEGFRHRDNLQDLPAPSGEPFTSNLEALYELLSEDDPWWQLVKAEVVRELGRFDEAIQLLAGDFPEKWRAAVARIRELAESGERLVNIVPPLEPGDDHPE